MWTGDACHYLNANPAPIQLVFATNTAGTKLIVNGVSGDDRFDETNSFKVGFATSHSGGRDIHVR